MGGLIPDGSSNEPFGVCGVFPLIAPDALVSYKSIYNAPASGARRIIPQCYKKGPVCVVGTAERRSGVVVTDRTN